MKEYFREASFRRKQEERKRLEGKWRKRDQRLREQELLLFKAFEAKNAKGAGNIEYDIKRKERRKRNKKRRKRKNKRAMVSEMEWDWKQGNPPGWGNRKKVEEDEARETEGNQEEQQKSEEHRDTFRALSQRDQERHDARSVSCKTRVSLSARPFSFFVFLHMFIHT